MITTVLNWVLLGWFFWPIFVLALCAPYWIVNKAENFIASPILPIGLAIGAAWWRWSDVFPHTWGGAALAAGLYLLVGFGYSVLKFLDTLRRFRQDVQKILSECPNIPERDKADRLRCNLDNWGGSYSSQYEIKEGVARLKWNYQPIGNWWIWWPWFLCESAFEFVSNLGERLVNSLRGIYESMANSLSVRL